MSGADFVRVAPPGADWNCLGLLGVAFGSGWFCLVFIGYGWVCFGLLLYVWLCLRPYGSVWVWFGLVEHGWAWLGLVGSCLMGSQGYGWAWFGFVRVALGLCLGPLRSVGLFGSALVWSDVFCVDLVWAGLGLLMSLLAFCLKIGMACYTMLCFGFAMEKRSAMRA